MALDEVGATPTTDAADTLELLQRLLDVRAAALEAESRRRSELDALPLDRRESAANLVHYLALRDVDLRAEQRALARLGLSSLGRAEAHILATLDAILGRLIDDVDTFSPMAQQLDGATGITTELRPTDLGARGPRAATGQARLARCASEALGPAPNGRATRVMVTLPTEAATDLDLVREFVTAGMAVARINGAHDDPETWRSMARNVRAAALETERPVRILFDLAGPKLRTGELEPGPEVLRVRPERDDHGRVLSPARARFTSAAGVQPATSPPTVPVSAEVLQQAEAGDQFRLVDARGRKRIFTITEVEGTTAVGVADRTSYLIPGLHVTHLRNGDKIGAGTVGPLPALPSVIDLRAGDPLLVTLGRTPGRKALRGEDGRVVTPASISVDVPEFFEALGIGNRVLFDDGAIEAIVTDVETGGATLEITRPERAKLRPEKGINVPDRRVELDALTADDLAALEVAAEFTDLVGASYVGGPSDVLQLHRALHRLDADHIGAVLKIEHRVAFERLPDMLLTALRRPPTAVMVARGDLAVEVGYERLAEVQEEILWLCEAAHVPVIWATQVLESLAKRGAPTRAEVTDAAWSSRAECVMLNKGPFIPDSIRFLDDVLGRMHEHQSKRTPMLRRLSVARGATPLED